MARVMTATVDENGVMTMEFETRSNRWVNYTQYNTTTAVLQVSDLSTEEAVQIRNVMNMFIGAQTKQEL